MPTRTGVIGIDLGTSAVKVIVVDLSGTVRGSQTQAYPLHRPGPGVVESDPTDWWVATAIAVRAAMAQAGRQGRLEVAAVAVAGQMHGLVLVDGRGRAVRAAMSWADTRAAEMLEVWTSLPQADLARLGNPITAGMLGPQLAWVGEYERGVLEGATRAILPKDWIRQRLTGLPGTDPSDASATLLWDVVADAWARDLMPALGLAEDLLPPVRESAEVAGVLLAEVAAELGLPAGIPVAAGAGDTAAALLGTGLTVGPTQLTLGSGAQLIQLCERPVAGVDPVVHLYRAAEPGRWYVMAAVQNAGLALDWCRDVFGVDWGQLYAVLDTDPRFPGPVFVPYLTGERTPILAERSRATWDGLDLCHVRDDLLRAVLLGVAFAIRHALDVLPGSRPPALRVAGGGSTDRRLRQLLADVLNLPLQPLREMGVSAFGAARLAARVAGLPLPAPRPEFGDPVEPGPRAVAYQDGYQRYLEVVARLRSG
jgi:xylulokinase